MESQVPRGLALLLRSLQGVFPHIKLTTLRVVLIKLSTTDHHNVYEFTPSRSRRDHNWKGQELHWELRGICLFYDRKINVRLITKSTLTRPLAKSLRGWFICQIEIAENKANLTISVLLCKRKNWSKLINCALWWIKDYFSLLYLCKIKSKLKLAKNWHHHRKHRSPGGNEEWKLVAPLILLRSYTRLYGSDLWPFIRGVTSLYNVLQMFIE